MEIAYIIIFFITGTVLGSFYNVVGLRLANNGSIFKPKYSHCPKCGNRIKALELIPVISYLFLRGKCKNCHEKISVLYPIIELMNGILFALCFYSFGLSLELIIALSLVSLFVIVIVSDISYYIIPDEVTIFFGIIIAITNFFIHGLKGGLIQLAYGLIMFLVMYLLMLLGNFIFKKETLGGGDVKLLFVVGLTLNPLLGTLVIFISSFIALPVSLVFYFTNKENAIPFGPFILLALLAIYLMKIDTTNLIELFKLI